MMTATPMRLRWAGSVVLTALGSAILLAVVLWLPEHRELAGRVYVIFLGVLAVRLLARAVVVATTAPQERLFDLALRGRVIRTLPRAGDPDRIEHEIGLAMNRALELHHYLRPRLRVIAADRLAATHGVMLDEQTGLAKRLLGQEAWKFLRPDREPPADRLGPGMLLPELERIVTAVERL
ncbi:MAG: hypothetical protein M3P11_13725 [Actinomycetota bacterium]|nr:hypothetical protein [Actinomycetota bacterium]